MNSLSESFSLGVYLMALVTLSPVLFTIYMMICVTLLYRLPFWVSVCWSIELCWWWGLVGSISCLPYGWCGIAGKKLQLKAAFTSMQLIHSSWSILLLHSSFVILWSQLSFIDTITHLGHLLHYNMSDAPDINCKLHDMLKKPIAYYSVHNGSMVSIRY